jgi:hypothetical protein
MAASGLGALGFEALGKEHVVDAPVQRHELCAALLGCAATSASEGFPDVTETPMISFPSTRTPEYLRPPWKRFLYSLRPYTESTTGNGQARIDSRGVEYAGSCSDDLKPKVADWMPRAFVAGVTGGIEF